MQKIDDFIIKENGKFFVDFEEWKSGNGISYEHGDLIKFSFEGIKYIGNLVQISNDENLFEIKNFKEIKNG